MEVSSKLGTAAELADSSTEEWFHMQSRGGRIDPVVDLVEIGQFANADRNQLLCLTMWLAASVRSCGTADVIMADRGPLAWATVRLSTEHVEFDTISLETEEQVQEAFTFTS
jgi:hypothetical protein